LWTTGRADYYTFLLAELSYASTDILV